MKIGKLKVSNFLGIEDLDIDINNITLMIGPQSVGKSVALKLVYFFKKIRSYLLDHYLSLNENDQPNFSSYLSIKFKELFPMQYYKDCCEETPSSIFYDDGNRKYGITICEDITFDLNGFIKPLEEKLFNTVIEHRKLQGNNDTIELDNEDPISLGELLNKVLDEYLVNEMVIFIPAGRSSYVNLSNNIWQTLSTNTLNVDPIFKDFGATYERFRNFYNNWKLESKLLEKTLKATYVRESGHDYLKHDDSRMVELSFASSGQQELLPLGLVLEVLGNAQIGAQKVAIFVEEPEAHLFPEAQRDTVNFVIESMNKMEHLNKIDSNIFITTHSPYIMTSFNTLLLAGYLYEKDPSNRDRVLEILPEQTLIKPGITSAYYLNKNSVSLIDDNQIDADKLDDISNEILNSYERLLDIEFDEK